MANHKTSDIAAPVFYLYLLLFWEDLIFDKYYHMVFETIHIHKYIITNITCICPNKSNHYINLNTVLLFWYFCSRQSLDD